MSRERVGLPSRAQGTFLAILSSIASAHAELGPQPPR